MSVPQLVAHRGYATHFPENTLLAIHEALKSGACFVEFDVQCTADGVPVVFHDATLTRTTGIQKNLLKQRYKEIRIVSAHDPARFGKQFLHREVRIPGLSQVAALLRDWPQVTAFIELKEESLEIFGVAAVLKAVMARIAPVLKQSCIISYHDAALRAAREAGVMRIGRVLKTWSDGDRARAEELAPDFLICNHQKIPTASTPFWHGPWQWCFYEVTDPERAITLHARGADLIETMDIGGMLADARLKQGGCFERSAL